ncbi:MAG: PAS domain S-box protein [Proteobacteria bacterium]|nr:PAS domain S-box protein [Pseudomonadota bacterium]
METDTIAQSDGLKILVLEDSARDFELINEQLNDAGFTLKMSWVETEDLFISALHENQYDIIMSDFTLPGFDAFGALRISKEICPEVPFICVSGSIGEETAIELLKLGAVDYVLKDRPERLPFAVKRAIDEAREKKLRKKAQEELLFNYALFRIAGSTAKLGGWRVDLDTNIATWSEVVADIHEMPHGYAPGVTEGIRFYAPEWQDRITQVFTDCAERGIPYDEEMEIITRTGKRVWVRTIGEAVKNDEGKVSKVQGSFQDITERKQRIHSLQKANMELQASQKVTLDILENLKSEIQTRTAKEAELRKVTMAIEQAGETILITDPAGKIQYVNPAFETVSGYTPEEAVGKTSAILKSGQQDEAFYQNLWETISSGRVWKGRLVNKRKDGSLYTEAATISPVFDAAGKIINYVGVKRDITAQLELTAQFQQAQKMESVGRLAGGVAHDYNNMLSVILGYTEMAMGKVGTSDPLHEDLQEILNAARRSTDITSKPGSQAREMSSPMRRRIILSMPSTVVFRSSTTGSIACLRAKASNCRVMSVERLAALRIS